MEKIVILPVKEEIRKSLMEDYEFLENYKHSTGHPFIKQICQHRQNIILEYINGSSLQRE